MTKTFYKSCQLCLLLLISCLIIPVVESRALANSMSEALVKSKATPLSTTPLSKSIPITSEASTPQMVEAVNQTNRSTPIGDSTELVQQLAQAATQSAISVSETADSSGNVASQPTQSSPTSIATPLPLDSSQVVPSDSSSDSLNQPRFSQLTSAEIEADQSVAQSTTNNTTASSATTNASLTTQSSESQTTADLATIAQATPSSIVYLPDAATLAPVTPAVVADNLLPKHPQFSQSTVTASNTNQATSSVELGDTSDRSADDALPLASDGSNLASSQLVAQNLEAQENPALGDLYVPNLPTGSLATRGRLGVPASSISTPLAFGAQQGNLFTAIGYQATTRGIPGPRTSGIDDGGFSFGFGIGNSTRDVAMEVAITSVSTFRRTPLSAGTVSLKFHSMIEEDLAVAVGIENLIRWGGNDGGSSVYGVVTKRFRLTESPEEMFSTLTISGGVGTGRFRSIGDVRNSRGTFNAFGSVGIQVAPPVSVIADWSGQDLGLGVSVAPLANVPLTINAAFVDLTGNANSDARFVMGVGYGFRF